MPLVIDRLKGFARRTAADEILYQKCISTARRKAWEDYRALDHLSRLIDDGLLEH